ncbi:DUF397 domain-containing protein [Amycolatopsis lurida]
MSDSRPVDDKANIRNALDLTTANWHQVEPGVPSTLEYAFILHTDGLTYTVLRKAGETDTLYFTPTEWDAFRLGLQDGEYDL